ncbi:MAG TPA: WYL domain-containing protein [Polyangia bacterium]
MPAQETSSKAQVERLMTLIVRLSNTRRPLAFEEFAWELPAYQNVDSEPRAARSVESAKRTFERDKAILLSMGIPLSCVKVDDHNDLEKDGYIIDREDYLLPELDLTIDEAAALAVTAAVARQQAGLSHASQLEDAWRKLAFGGAPEAEADMLLIHHPHGADREQLAALDGAIKRRKRVTLDYRAASTGAATRRVVDPYGLVYRRGTWTLVGHCHEREAIRLFRVDRMAALEVATAKPGHPDFEVPADFHLSDYRRLSPWTFALDEPAAVVLAIDPGLAAVAEEDFGRGAEHATEPDGSLRVRFTCRNLDYLTRRVLGAAGRLRVLEPAAVREHVRTAAAAIAANYGGRP